MLKGRRKICLLSCIFLFLLIVSLSIGSIANAARPKLTLFWLKTFIAPADQYIYDLANEFAREKNIDLEIIKVPGPDSLPKVLASIESGTPPDVCQMNPPTFGMLIGTDELMDISDVVKDIEKEWGGFFDFVIPSVTIGNKVLGLPYCAEVESLFIRKDLLEENGLSIPETYEDLKNVGIKLTTKDMYGLGITLGRCPDADKFLHSLVFAFGGALTTPDGKKITANSPNVRKALGFVKEMWDAGIIPEGSPSWNDAGNNKAYQGRKVAIVENTGSIYWWMLHNDLDLKARTVITPLPKGPAGRYVIAHAKKITIFKKTKYPELAKELVRYLYKPEHYKEYVRISGGQFQPIVPKLKDMYLWKDPYLEPFMKSLLSAVPYTYPASPTPAAYEILGRHLLVDAVQSVILQGLTPEQALAKMEERMKEIYETWK